MMRRLLGLMPLIRLPLSLGIYRQDDMSGPSVMAGDDDEAMYADDLQYLEVYAP